MEFDPEDNHLLVVSVTKESIKQGPKHTLQVINHRRLTNVISSFVRESDQDQAFLDWWRSFCGGIIGRSGVH